MKQRTFSKDRDRLDPAARRFEFIGGALCLDFANTVDWHAGVSPEDKLRGFPDLLEWAFQAGVIGVETVRRLTAESLKKPDEASGIFRRAGAFRESLYGLLAGIAHDRRPSAEALAAVNSVLSEALGHLALTQGPGGFRLDWPDLGSGMDRILWPIARSAADLLAFGDPSRIRQCADDRGCGWLFLDRSRNRSRRWCSMEDCGNRAKAGRHFRRRKESVT